MDLAPLFDARLGRRSHGAEPRWGSSSPSSRNGPACGNTHDKKVERAGKVVALVWVARRAIQR
jgi:hypothetical protein